MVTQFWKRRLGPTTTNQTLNESWHWLAGKALKHAKPTITEQISNPPMHIRNSDVRKPSWAETHEQKPSRHIRTDNLDHCISSHGGGEWNNGRYQSIAYYFVGESFPWGEQIIDIDICGQQGAKFEWAKHHQKKNINISSFGKGCLSLGVGLDLLLPSLTQLLLPESHDINIIIIIGRNRPGLISKRGCPPSLTFRWWSRRHSTLIL